MLKDPMALSERADAAASHGFRIHVIIKCASRPAAAATIHSWLSDWFVNDLGEAEAKRGSLLFYRIEDDPSLGD